MATRSLKMSENVTSHLLDIAKQARGSVSIGFIDSEQAPIAFWNEFGHKGRFPAPARPFFRTMISKESPQWPVTMAAELKRSNFNGKQTLAFMGEEIDGQLKESIIDFSGMPLSPTTLRLRYKFGNNPQNIRARDVLQAQQDVRDGKKQATGTQAKPLVWSGQMLRSTEYQVDDSAIMRYDEKSKSYQERA